MVEKTIEALEETKPHKTTQLSLQDFLSLKKSVDEYPCKVPPKFTRPTPTRHPLFYDEVPDP